MAFRNNQLRELSFFFHHIPAFPAVPYARTRDSGALTDL